MDLNRRESLALFSMAAVGAAQMPSASNAQMPSASSQAAPAGFDPQDPVDNLNGFVKLMGDTSGQPQWMIAQGRIYALEDGEMPIPLVGVHGLRYLKFDRDGDEFVMSMRDWGYYTDYTTGEVLESYKNPYTGETNSPAPLLTRYTSWRMGPDGQTMDGYTGEAWLIGRPLRMPWAFQGGMTTVTLELLVKYGNGGFGAEWINMSTNTADFIDPNLTSAPMQYSWTGYSPWMRWLNMGDRPGRTLWNSNGFNATSLAQLDPQIRDAHDRHYPGSLQAPETYEKTGGQTSTE